MGVLYLVRHGKAAELREGAYDSLSATGWKQAAAIGQYWRAREQTFDHVFVGPRQRHQETLDGTFAAMGRTHHDVQKIDDLDEHAGLMVVKNTPSSWLETRPEAKEIAKRIASGESNRDDLLAAFRVVVRAWVDGELCPSDVENWSAFRERASRGLRTMVLSCAGRGTSVAFTSAGTIAAAVGGLLGANDRAVLDLSWRLYNASVTEVVIGRDGVSMRTFNETAHLMDDELRTQV